MARNSSKRLALKEKEQYYLLYWAAENSVTSVPSSTVTLEGTPCLGAYCNVKGYDGVIAAIGNKQEVEEVERLFINELWIPDFTAGVPAPIKKVQNPLPSTAITETLASVTSTLSKYEKLQTECRAPTLAVKLAKESLFGDQVMKQCTVMGAKTQPALPLKELNELKSIIFGLFPKYRNSPFQFETLWMKCVDALGHACRRLRRLPA
ncbi:hypothetical protein EMCRGX_G001729 [Ephydatia muelleri]